MEYRRVRPTTIIYVFNKIWNYTKKHHGHPCKFQGLDQAIQAGENVRYRLECTYPFIVGSLWFPISPPR